MHCGLIAAEQIGGVRRFVVGDTWVDAEVCDACECSQYGVQSFARLDDGRCKLNSKTSY